MVSLVSASELGQELVTCGDFECDTDWVGFTPSAEDNWSLTTQAGEDVATYSQDSIPSVIKRKNLSQAISIKANRKYNVSMEIFDSIQARNAHIGLDFYLGRVKTFVFANETLTNEPFSFEITALTNDGLFLEGSASSSSTLDLNFISVKEIIPTPDTFLLRLQTATQTNEIIIELKEDTKFSVIAKAIKILWKIWIT